MVKINAKLFVLSFVIFIFLMNVAYAAGSKLIFSKVDVKVGGKTDRGLNDGDIIGEDAKPGDNLEFKVKTENNFTNEEKLKIKDITVKVTIEGIDDGEDLEEESNSFDLSQGSDKSVTLKFQVPIEVDEDTFDVLIHIEGEDKNGTNHENDMTLRLEVNKDSHKLKIIKNTLSPAEVTCNRKNVQLSIGVVNIGTEDEQDVTIEAQNSDLGIDFKDEVSELIAEPNEPESRFSKTYSFKVPDELEAGSYPITLTASYDDDRKKAEETATLTVNDCQTSKPETIKKPEEKTPTEETTGEEQPVEVITPSPTTGRTTTTVETQPEVPEGTVVTQESFLGSNAFVVGIIIAEVIAVLVGIVLVVSLFRRRS